ncbi:MAG: LCP family protein [Lachnospiraceae bacterium]|nr:LCP family protein [Lachnospiraceae bacterium]
MSNSNNRKKRRKNRKTLFVILIIACVVVAAGIVTLVITGKTKRQKNAGEPDTTKQIETTEPETEPLSTDVTQFVIFGIDDVGYTPDDIYRSDMIMVVSIDETEQKIHLVSLLRDTRVPIEGLEPQKLNKAYQAGGPELALKTINDAFHTSFDKYITLDWQDLVFLVDDIGGIDLEITGAEAELLNRMVKKDISREGRNADCIPVYEGYAHLDGTQATHFSRIRSLDTDYHRAWRQHRVLNAIQKKVQTLSLDDLPGLAKFLMDNNVETNITKDDVLAWISKGVINYQITDAVIPDSSYESNIYGGTDDATGWWVWIYDLEEGATRLHSIID